MPGREKGRRHTNRPNPLGEDLHADRFASAKRSAMSAAETTGDVDVEGGLLLPGRMAKKILKTAREQLEAVAEEEAEDHSGLPAVAYTSDGENEEDPGLAQLDCDGRGLNVFHGGNEEDDVDEEVFIEYDDTESAVSEIPSEVDMGADMYGIDEEEARLLQKFQPQSRALSRNLADMITEKIKEREDVRKMAGTTSTDDGVSELGEGETRVDPRVARVYTAIGTILKKYTSGKIPKAFKVLPNIKNWEQLLMLTKPHEWSPHATYQATRIFAANLNERMAQRFYAAVLLPMVHERMSSEKKLHPALYMAIRKALFKPVAFFKGFILPLTADEECTLKEALVVASVLQRMHLPPVPTAVTIVKLAQQPFSGPRSVLLRVLIDKKMAMPYQAIDALVGYFHRFVTSHSREEKLPVLWHQTLLSFAQRYKGDLTEEQVTLLLQVCSTHFHYLITPEVRRELNAAPKKTQSAKS
ncbi:putative Bystin [Trypanosoma vivax]|uniref:Putative bystin n=1 Tax=Trypanosoma vivax (strain Y486) TaxID=1055687 RepID=G0TWK6_TRYVY|nr:putative bystin [Trypanosoma vivax]KAH8609219.1 putative Bystin [Trypanosoma vivax]CCC48344.1 putative bystin [Trypanosoma vivax Y486]